MRATCSSTIRCRAPWLELRTAARATDHAPDQSAPADGEPREHVLAPVTAHLGRRCGSVVRLLLREAPDPRHPTSFRADRTPLRGSLFGIRDSKGYAHRVIRSPPTQKEDRMAFTFRLELEDETPADPPVLHTVGRCPYCSLRRRPECRRLRGRTYPAPRRRGRCPECAREYERRRGSAHSRGYAKEHKRLAAQVIAAHPFCVDCGATTDLCADHVLPISRGGTNTLDNYQVRCRSCNTARRDVDRRRPAAIKSHLR